MEEARTYLEPAAAGLPDDPWGQDHQSMTYAALGEAEKAQAQLKHALVLAGKCILPQFDLARAKPQKLSQ